MKKKITISLLFTGLSLFYCEQGRAESKCISFDDSIKMSNFIEKCADKTTITHVSPGGKCGKDAMYFFQCGKE